ncbi:protein NODULATION SIGNALING PATHWAY 1 [Salvia miltiorrhiza]|uniref:protein NODULATION SIGNALING PATHWAY 1 n=1 Tax=Salvia miltiorrhiza TaxID=226208 RepID=UPI0025ACEC59|nr:protein NODULATION SIGNALING PATHWAY 1 [Salvia miltiorrhiza]
MTIDGSETGPPPDHIVGWIEESISYFPTIFDDPYEAAGDFSGDSWWDQSQSLEQLINSSFNSYNTPALAAATASAAPTPADSMVSDRSLSLDLSKKRKLPDDLSPKTVRKSNGRRGHEADAAAAEATGVTKKPAGNKKGGKSAGSGGGGNKEGRWAEQLLNPCAAAITGRNPSRVQHFLYVLHDLASLNGDANHRLAHHGLRAITHHLSGAGAGSFSSSSGDTFATSNLRFFSNSLIKFNDINPWFRIPNNVANTSILQILGEQHQPTNLHILDIGVSHGLQWPTLLEELTRRAGGPPPLVRLTVVPPPTKDEESRNATPFAHAPQNYDFTSKLLAFAKDMNVNLQINKMDNFHLQNLNSQAINSTSGETLVVCAQFRLHNLSHSAPDDRTEFLRVLRSLQPKGVILSENNTDCSCNSCGDFTTAFSRRVDYLWRFLDSTSVAYKSRESDERRMIEAEAAKVLVNVGEMNERKEKWCERMKNAGFKGQVLGEETVDGARALLRKYDSHWEIQADEKDGCIGLWWKGQPVSFCSLWKMDVRVKECLT